MGQIRVVRAALMVAVSLWLTGCPDPGGTVLGLSISPSPVTVAVGKTQALTVTATYGDGTSAVVTLGLAYDSSDPSVATVNAVGVVTGVAAGPATVTVVGGSLIATVDVTVK